jgi:5-hydroxyisourate hydrolase
MARLSTHVLDTVGGKPAAGMRIRLYRCDGDARRQVKTVTTNADGRTDEPLIEGESMAAGVYELVFDVAGYFGGGPLSFFGDVVVRFGVADAAANYHVPLLVAPYGYSTYRGS